MKKLDIALLAGGNSSEREIALQSAAEVAKSLDDSRYNIYLIDVDGRDWTYTAPNGEKTGVDKNDFSLTVQGRKVALEYALIIIHGSPGEDGKMQGYLEMMGIPYSSCDMVSTVITFDKATAKRTVEAYGVRTAPEIMIRKGEPYDPEQIVARLGLPVFVKPNASGSSFGVTKVSASADIPAAVEAAFAEGETVLVESFVDGREIACSIVVAAGREIVLPLTEIISKNEFFDYQAKYTPGYSEEITPAEIDEHTAQAVRRQALAAYRACKCRGLVRVDFIVDKSGTPIFIEVNTIPGLSNGSIVPKQAAAAGIGQGEIFDLIISGTAR